MKNSLVYVLFALPFLACSESVSSNDDVLYSNAQSDLSSSSEKIESSSSLLNSSSSQEVKSNTSELKGLPFDTTGIKADSTRYEYLLKKYAGNDYLSVYRNEYGDSLDNFILVNDDGGYCYTPITSTGITTGHYISNPTYNCILMVHGDSLLFTNVRDCSGWNWNACRESKDAYFEKIKVGDEYFYYGRFEKLQELIHLTDSTIVIWKKQENTPKNPSKFEWKKEDFENDSLVTFLSSDTIYIEKYNVKITDDTRTWVFENETCTSMNYVVDSTKSKSENCTAYGEYKNSSIRCIQKNMNVPSFDHVYPNLCRPMSHEYMDGAVWCILDESLEDYVKRHGGF